jgi:signal transduction histidine kinase
MISPEFPENELERQKAVEKYELLDTLAEENYDNITALLSYICDTPISLIGLLDKDRNFLKSHHGIPFNESPRELSFCGHAINSQERIMIVKDARQDERFHDNPLVSEHDAVFYAGVPLVDPAGFKLGTLCVYDTKPRELSLPQITALKNMAKQVVLLFEERHQKAQLKKAQETLKLRNKNLEHFAAVVSHDLKSPLAQITALTGLLEEDNQNKLSEETLLYLDYIKSSSESLRNYIDGLLDFYKTDTVLKQKHQLFHLSKLIDDVIAMYQGFNAIEILYESNLKDVQTNKSALQQVFVNLVANAIKYNDKEHTQINVIATQKETHYLFSVSDNGPGIPKDKQTSIFDLFTTLKSTDKYGVEGTGIGLATVKKLVNKLGGDITVDSQLGVGSTFTFTISK